MHQTLSDKDLQEYYRTSLLPAGIRPNGCTRANCLEKLHFHHHSSYSRNSVYRQGYGWLPIIWIERFRCASCRKVISLLIPTVYKWQRAEHDLQQAVALKQPYPKEEVTEAFSERTLLRWKQKWQEWCGLHLQAICTWLFTLYAFLSTDVTAKQARTPMSYLQALLAQLPGKSPVAVEVVSVCRFGGGQLRSIPHFLSLVFAGRVCYCFS